MSLSIIDKIKIIYEVSDLDEAQNVQPSYTSSGMSKDPCYALACNDNVFSAEQCAIRGLIGAKSVFTGKRLVLYWPDIRKSMFTEADTKELEKFRAARDKVKRDFESERAED